MQAAVTHDYGTAELPAMYRMLFDRFWEDVAPLNNFSPEAAQAILKLEAPMYEQTMHDEFVTDPVAAIHAALRERAAGRQITPLA